MSIAKDSKRIDSVTVKRISDDDGDLSWLGEFSDEPQNDFAIVATGRHAGEFVEDLPCECGLSRSEHTECNGKTIGDDCEPGSEHCCEFDRVEVSRGREYRYFSPEVDPAVTDKDEQRKYALQDYERMRDYGQTWSFIGIRAEAKIAIKTGDSWLTQTVISGGLWGIESDSEESYFKETEDEQLAELKDQLHALGFSKRAIAAAFRNVTRKEY